MKIDFVSDVSCPWCAIGLKSLETALDRVSGQVQAELHFQPFELNPQMAPEGQDIVEHLSQKYGISATQIAQNQANIRARGAAVGFEFSQEGRHRIYNTFDAHRLLHWAEEQGRQRELKHALLGAYFTDGQDPQRPRPAAARGRPGRVGRGTRPGDSRIRRVRRRGARAPAVLPAARHQLGAGRHHQ
jgi:predicted DsbA family dithiol-disulfide isomerase